MGKLDDVLLRVLKKITPTKAERARINFVTRKILNTMDEVLKPLKLSRTMAGSFLRDTWLPDKKEFDVFIMFPDSYSRERLEKEGLRLGKKIVSKLGGKYVVSYAEHPYVRSTISGYSMDIVPCYKLSSAKKIKSAVDRTPFHNKYITEKLPANLSPQVRLLKQFCEGLGIYGSDTKTMGFSGYLCELLIINYGTFKRVAQEAAEWLPGKLIDVEELIKDTKPLKQKFKGQPLIVIDPVDSNRNVAAVLSPENFMKFTKACEDLLEKPRESLFRRKPVKFGKQQLAGMFKRRGTGLLALKFKEPDVVPDVLWPQLRKSAKRLKGILEEQGFSVMYWNVWSGNKLSIILFELETHTLPAIKKVVGPTIFSAKGPAQFMHKYKSGRVFVEGDSLVAEVVRKRRHAEEHLFDAVKSSRKKLLERGIPSHIAKSLSSNFSILRDEKALALAAKNPELGELLGNYLKKTMI